MAVSRRGQGARRRRRRPGRRRPRPASPPARSPTPSRARAGVAADLLGAGGPGALDLGAACAGFTYGLALAADTVRGGSARHVLVIGSERFSDILDPDRPRHRVPVRRRRRRGRRRAPPTTDGIGPVGLEQRRRLRAASCAPTATRRVLQMDGRAVYRWATTSVPALAREACEKAGIALEDLAAFVPHQANLRITESLVKSLRAARRRSSSPATSSTAATPARPPCRSPSPGCSSSGRCAAATPCCCSASAPASPPPDRSSAAPDRTSPTDTLSAPPGTTDKEHP